jgi:hypothetical protein
MSLINRKETKKVVLELMKVERPNNTYTQVGKDFLDDLEGSLINLIRKKFELVPRTGKTIRF